MDHCVATYARKVSASKSSIWSMRCDGKRAVTIEVRNHKKTITHVCCRKDRDPTECELRIIARWARDRGLEIEPRCTGLLPA